MIALIATFQCIQAFALTVIAYCMLIVSKSWEYSRYPEAKAAKKKSDFSVAWKKPPEKKYRAKVYEE